MRRAATLFDARIDPSSISAYIARWEGRVGPIKLLECNNTCLKRELLSALYRVYSRESWDVMDEEKLIEAVRSCPCLWQVTSKGYKDIIAKENAWKEVAVQVR